MNKNIFPNLWVGQLSQYSDWLRAGRSGDRIPVGVRFSAPVQTGPGAHPASCTMGTGSFPQVKQQPRRDPYRLAPSSAVIKKEQSYTSTPPVDRTACTEPQCLYSTAIPLLPSVPVQYSYNSAPPMGHTACTELQCLYSTAIPLLPSVPVQYSYTSTPLSACTVQL